jgi:hypothetical protein
MFGMPSYHGNRLFSLSDVRRTGSAIFKRWRTLLQSMHYRCFVGSVWNPYGKQKSNIESRFGLRVSVIQYNRATVAPGRADGAHDQSTGLLTVGGRLSQVRRARGGPLTLQFPPICDPTSFASTSTTCSTNWRPRSVCPCAAYECPAYEQECDTSSPRIVNT